MKPSKRIYEIKQMREKGQRVPSDLIYQMYINAILEFLDEEWEKKNETCDFCMGTGIQGRITKLVKINPAEYEEVEVNCQFCTPKEN